MTEKTISPDSLGAAPCSASSLYSDKLRSLIDGWLDGPILRHMGFGYQMEYVHGWLTGHPPHLTGVNRKINMGEAQSIVFSYFHDPLARFELEGYGGGGGLINSLPNAERIHGGAGQSKQSETPTPLDGASC